MRRQRAPSEAATRGSKFDALCTYADLVPSTYASGGAIYNGKLLGAANKWLHWALVEAAWVSIGSPGVFVTRRPLS